MKTPTALAAFALLAACTSGPSGGPQVVWRCDGGAAFSVRYNDRGAAEVFAGGRTYTLPAARSGSGARYSDGTVEYWEHQGEARLNGAFGGPYNNCRSS
jgi:membrane-bound inhibitor of C-type lysozyme